MTTKVANNWYLVSRDQDVKGHDGFTFIELLLTLAILAIISTVSLTIFRETIRTYTKSNSLIDIKANGTHVMSVLEEKIRNADSIIAYDSYGGCMNDCASAWLLLSPKDGLSDECVYIGVVVGVGANPDTWGENGYVFAQESTACSALDLVALEALGGEPSSDPAFSGPRNLTNRNETDPESGVNVRSLTFTIDNPRNRPAVVTIDMQMSQGVSGTTIDPPPDRKVQVNLESTVSLR